MCITMKLLKVTLNTRLDLRLVFSLKNRKLCENFNLTRLPLPKPSETCLCFGLKKTKSVLSYSWNNIDNRFCEIHARLLNPMW